MKLIHTLELCYLNIGLFTTTYVTTGIIYLKKDAVQDRYIRRNNSQTRNQKTI
jgi:hypothetical protein